MSEPIRNWLVWSYKHSGWWKPGDMGYTQRIYNAGRFTQAEAWERSQTMDNEGFPQEVPVGPDLVLALGPEGKLG